LARKTLKYWEKCAMLMMRVRRGGNATDQGKRTNCRTKKGGAPLKR